MAPAFGAVRGLVGAPAFAQAAPCAPTGFVRDGFVLTAAQIGGDVTGELDATGCDIGVYYAPGASGNVTGATIHGARYFGVIADGATVNVSGSNVNDIGNDPFDGSQHGVGIYFTNGASGDMSGNSVSAYQKGGIVVNGDGTTATVTGNTVTGLGPVDYIAQNGIQVSRGAVATVRGNDISGNFYAGHVGVGPNPGGQNPPGWEYFSTGLLLFQRARTHRPPRTTSPTTSTTSRTCRSVAAADEWHMKVCHSSAVPYHALVIAIVDYGVGNLANLERALRRAGAADVRITRSHAELLAARAIVLPGVGHFGHCARELRRFGLDAMVRVAHDRGIPLLGLCVGMQLFFEDSEEDPGTPGLALAPGHVRRLRGNVRVPHTGWNEVRVTRPHPWLAGVPGGAYFYFVHSYAAEPTDHGVVVGSVDHGGPVTAAVGSDGMLGLQFHPEKSGAMGIRVLRSFVRATDA